MFQQGMQRGQLQIPVSPPEFDDGQFQFSIIETRRFSQLLYLQAALALHEGRTDESLEAIDKALQFGRMLANSGVAIQFLIGVTVQGAAVRRVEQWAVAPLDRSVHDSLMRSLDRAVNANDVADVLRRELCLWAIPGVEQMDALTSPDEMLDRFVSGYFINRLYTAGEQWADDGRATERRAAISALLDCHPHLWDVAATVRLMSDFVSAQITALQANQPMPAWPESLDWWPTSLATHVPYDCLGKSEGAKAERARFASLMGVSPKSFEPLTARALFKCQARLQKINNPLGRLVASNYATNGLDLAFRTHVERTSQVRQTLMQRAG